MKAITFVANPAVLVALSSLVKSDGLEGAKFYSPTAMQGNNEFPHKGWYQVACQATLGSPLSPPNPGWVLICGIEVDGVDDSNLHWVNPASQVAAA